MIKLQIHFIKQIILLKLTWPVSFYFLNVAIRKFKISALFCVSVDSARLDRMKPENKGAKCLLFVFLFLNLFYIGLQWLTMLC